MLEINKLTGGYVNIPVLKEVKLLVSCILMLGRYGLMVLVCQKLQLNIGRRLVIFQKPLVFMKN